MPRRQVLAAFAVGLALGAVALIGLRPRPIDGTVAVPADATTIQEAVDRAPEGGLVTIEGGRYKENVVVSRSVEIAGDWNVDWVPALAGEPTLAVGPGAALAVRGVSLRGNIAGPEEPAGAALEARFLEVHGGHISGHFDRAVLRSVRIHDALGPGVLLRSVTHAALHDVEVRRPSGTGVVVRPGDGQCHVSITATRVREAGGSGFDVGPGDCTAHLDDIEVDGAYAFGVHVRQDTAIRQARITDVKAVDGAWGDGVMFDFASGLVDSTRIAGTHRAGIVAGQCAPQFGVAVEVRDTVLDCTTLDLLTACYPTCDGCGDACDACSNAFAPIGDLACRCGTATDACALETSPFGPSPEPEPPPGPDEFGL